jgi:hypothetical protein
MEQNLVAKGLSEAAAGQTLEAAWDDLLEDLSEDWSDLLVEVELRPGALFQPALLIVSALNPERCDDGAAFRFRIGHDFGYGAAASVARRCLALLDERGFEGRLLLLELLSQRRPLETQGPIWRLEGRSL